MTAPRDPSIPGELDRALDAHHDGEALRAVWRALPDAASVAAPASDALRDAAWARLRARLDDPARRPTPNEETPGIPLLREEAVGVPPARPARARWLVAASVAVLAGSGLAWRALPERMSVDAGQAPRTFTLADGSRLELAPGSSARMARGFRHVLGWRASARSVRLEGEAFFDVARDGRPFVVETAAATVRVLGTRFDVRAAARGGTTRVLVEAGRVAVEARRSAAVIELGAGEGAVAGGDEPPHAVALPVARLTSWRTGGLAALDEPLGAVLDEMQRRFGVRIALEGSVRTDERVSLFYPAVPAIESVIADLCTMRGLAYRRTSDGYVIGPGPVRP